MAKKTVKKKNGKQTKEDKVTKSVEIMEDVKPFESYEKFLEAMKKKGQRAVQSMLRYYWELGAHVKWLKDKSTYGDSSIAKASEDLGLSTTTLRYAGKFHERWTWEQVDERFVDKSIPYYAVLDLASIEDEKFRDKVERLLLDGELAPKDVREEKKKHNKALQEPEEDDYEDPDEELEGTGEGSGDPSELNSGGSEDYDDDDEPEDDAKLSKEDRALKMALKLAKDAALIKDNLIDWYEEVEAFKDKLDDIEDYEKVEKSEKYVRDATNDFSDISLKARELEASLRQVSIG